MGELLKKTIQIFILNFLLIGHYKPLSITRTPAFEKHTEVTEDGIQSGLLKVGELLDRLRSPDRSITATGKEKFKHSKITLVRMDG